jgi:hypothetical protein
MRKDCMMPMIDSFQKKSDALFKSEGFKKLVSLFKKGILVVVIGMIAFNLWKIGLQEILASLPMQPAFYVLFVFIFLSLPVAEIFIYRQVWDIGRLELFKAMLTKRVLNDEVLGYSGELYLLPWAKKHLDKSDWEIISTIRDNNILSSLNATFIAFVLIGVLILTGVIDAGLIFNDVSKVYLITGAVAIVAFVAVFLQFRKYLFNLPFRKALIILSIYFSRFITHHLLMVAQWAVVMPETPLNVWLIFITIVIVVNRIPFLPSRDLVFLWAGIELSKVLSLTTASVAGMLLVFSVLNKVVNLLLYVLITWKGK